MLLLGFSQPREGTVADLDDGRDLLCFETAALDMLRPVKDWRVQ